ncbi:TIM-barrel domain-containing protein [Adhaeribacter rhizoryzae]|uniref:TIM-barrel domain-containing protein n=1 Tax=Adhaeribacter rhizoryzae TaxID=2607907 RepID=UPI00167FE093|nr:TIM-barrel domain-containing protein [Adhaeribacter rhizoryzae]
MLLIGFSYSGLQAQPGNKLPAIIQVKRKAYELNIQPAGFKYAFKVKGKEIAGFHPVSGLRFSAAGDTVLYDAVSTRIISKSQDLLRLAVTNTKGNKAEVNVYLSDEYLNIKVKPEAGASYAVTSQPQFVIDIRTAPVQPAYGLGDHGGYGPSTNVFGFADNRFLNTDNGLRFVSSFAIFPAQGLGQVIFENGHKRIGLNSAENKMGAAKVSGINAYYFFGPPATIYKNYAQVKAKEGYPDLKPKYDFFELGYEAFGSLGWNTYQASVQKDLETYLQKGYYLNWAVVGSGFWKGERKKPEEGSTNSFGIWDDIAEPGRKDGLPNPRYPDVATFKAFLQQNHINLLLGLRTNFKAPKDAGGFYNPTNNGPFPLEGLQQNYYVADAQSKPIPYKVNFPQGNIYILNPDKPAAVQWFADGFRKWGVQGYKEDMMLHDGIKLNNDAKLNKVNEHLMKQGNLVMVRNSAFSVPGDIIRLEDTKHGFDQDRPVINMLNYAASGAPNVYPDIVAGKYLTLPLTEDQKKYFVRNAMFSAVSPAMSVGLGPWHMENPAYEAAVKKACNWHNQLAPYIYSAAVDAFETGYPTTLTPLPIAFPHDTATYNLATKTKRQYAWLLGPSLLVTPAYGNDYATVERRSVYLPAGTWQDLESGEIFRGPTTLKNYAFPINKIPAFVGGQGVLVKKEQTDLYATVFALMPRASTYRFTYPDGNARSLINRKTTNWQPDKVQVQDITAGRTVQAEYLAKDRALKFKIEAGHDYEISSSRPEKGKYHTPVNITKE